jgi:hypothetical protein
MSFIFFSFLHFSEQNLTLSQSLSHFFRQAKGLLHFRQIFCGKLSLMEVDQSMSTLQQSLPFVEKYRPINIDNIVEQNDVLNSIKERVFKKYKANSSRKSKQ